MARLRAKHLPHRVGVERLVGEGAEGEVWEKDPVPVPAYVEQKLRLVVDRRSTSPTFGQEIQASTFVVLLTTNDVAPRSRVTVHAGTPRERTSEVIASALFHYNARTPNHVEAYLE
jgi:hypothetical protein